MQTFFKNNTMSLFWIDKRNQNFHPDFIEVYFNSNLPIIATFLPDSAILIISPVYWPALMSLKPRMWLNDICRVHGVFLIKILKTSGHKMRTNSKLSERFSKKRNSLTFLALSGIKKNIHTSYFKIKNILPVGGHFTATENDVCSNYLHF